MDKVRILNERIVWHVDSLLGNDREILYCITPTAINNGSARNDR
jgi:hypothetical protein